MDHAVLIVGWGVESSSIWGDTPYCKSFWILYLVFCSYNFFFLSMLSNRDHQKQLGFRFRWKWILQNVQRRRIVRIEQCCHVCYLLKKLFAKIFCSTKIKSFKLHVNEPLLPFCWKSLLFFYFVYFTPFCRSFSSQLETLKLCQSIKSKFMQL